MSVGLVFPVVTVSGIISAAQRNQDGSIFMTSAGTIES